MFYPSGYYRKAALKALKGHWQTALLVALVVNLPTLLMQGFSAATGNDVADRLQALILTASRDGVLTQKLLLDEINGLLNSSGFWTIRGLELLAWLVTPCLTLGMYKWLMNRLDGMDDPVSTVFCRVNLFFRAIGLQLLVILKVLLWMLPGIAGYAYMTYRLFFPASAEAQLETMERFTSMSLPLLLLLVIPAAMAALRYALAEYVMADVPSSKILFCIRRSKFLMKDQKKSLFFLVVSFLLLYLLSLLVASLLSGVFSLVVQMLASLALSVYMSCSVAVFYRKLEYGESKTPPEQEPLN